jgi:glycosyltransferase involved in cell wall biosynthesis
MKLLMVAPQPFFQERGTPLSILHRLRAVSVLGHSTDLATYHIGDDVTIDGVGIHRTLRLPFIKRVKVGPSMTKFPLDIALFFKALGMTNGGGYDFIHSHEEGAVIGCVLKWLYGVPHVYDMHSSLPEQLVNYDFTRSRVLLALARWVERWIIRQSDMVVAVCPSLAEKVRRIHPGKPVAVIENLPVGVADAAPDPEGVRALVESLDIGDARVVLYTGTFEVNQGLDLLLRAVGQVVEQTPETVFVLVGGEAEQLQAMQAEAEQLRVVDHLRLVGRRPPAEMSSYMAMADVLASPRKVGSNTPLKIYSYLGSGKPIVATDLPTHTQVLSRDEAVLVEPTAEGFARGILTVLRDDSLAERLGNRGRRLVEERYDWTAFVEKTRSVYEQLQPHSVPQSTTTREGDDR